MTRKRTTLFLFYITVFLVFLNFNTAQTITPIYVLDSGGTEFHSGLQNTLFFLMAVILRFFFGPLADRKGVRLTLFIGAFVFATAPLLFMVSDAVWYIILIRVYQSIGLATFFSSSASLASALAPEGKIGAYLGYYRFVTMVTIMVGPAAAMSIIEHYGYRIYDLTGFLIGVCSLGILYLIPIPAHKCSISSHSDITRSSCNQPSPARVSMLEILKEKQLLPIYLCIFAVAFSHALSLTFVAIFIERAVPLVNPGIFFTVFGLASMISSLTLGPLSDKTGRGVVVFPSMLCVGLGIGLLYFIPTYPVVIYIGSFISGFGFSASISVCMSWVVDLVDANRRTSAISLLDNSIDIGFSLGSFCFGILVPLIGMSYSFGLSGIVLTAFSIWKISQLLKFRRKMPLTSE